MTSIDLWTSYAAPALKLGIWLALLAVIFVPLERAFSLAGARSTWSDKAVDTGFYFLNSLVPATLLGMMMSLVAVVGHAIAPDAYFQWVAALPLWATLPLALLVSEVGFYWGHRWAHEIPFLWRFHAVHHRPDHIHWMVNTRGHPVDMIFVRLCGLTPLYLLGIARFADPTGNAVASLAIVAGTFWGFFIHANVSWRLGFLEKVVATPFFHHWHHTRGEPVNRNYAAMIPIVDRLFGTYHMPDHWPTSYGVDEDAGRADDHPTNSLPSAPSPSPARALCPSARSRSSPA